MLKPAFWQMAMALAVSQVSKASLGSSNGILDLHEFFFTKSLLNALCQLCHFFTTESCFLRLLLSLETNLASTSIFPECQCNPKGVADGNLNCSDDDGICTCKESHSGDIKCGTCAKTYFGENCDGKCN